MEGRLPHPNQHNPISSNNDDQSTQPDYSSYLNSLQACLQEDFNTAVLQGNHEMVARLLPYVNAGMLLNPNPRDPIKFTPLHHAVWVGDLKMVGILIDHNPDCSYLLKQEDAFGRTPLWIAAAQWIAAHDNGPLDKDKVKQSYFNIFSILLSLLDQGADSTKIVEPDDGIALLHQAAKRGQKSIVEALVTNFILLNQKIPERLDLRDADGATPLLLAVIDGNTKMADYLIDQGANPNLVHQHPSNANCADNGKTPLHLALQHGRTKTAVMLIQRGVHIPPDITPACLMPALYLAFAKGNVEVVAILVKKSIDVTQISVLHPPTDDSRSFVNEVARGGNLDMFKALVTGNPHFEKVINYADPHGQTALMCAAEHGHTEVVAYLLDKGADLNAVTHGFAEKEDNNITALDLAKKYKRFNIVALLLQKMADVTKPVDPIVKYFINQKNDQSTYPDYSSYLNSLQACFQQDFNAAVLQGDHEMVTHLLSYVKAGILFNPNPLDPMKFTPLHHAVSIGDLKMVEILIDHHPYCSYLLKQEDAHGHTPLWIAATQWIAAHDNEPLESLDGRTFKLKQSYYNIFNILLFLLNKGADSTKIVEPRYGTALLHRAARERGTGKRIIAALITNFTLLKQKIPERLDLRDADGATPLSLAATTYDATEMVDYLIGQGANPNLVHQHPSNENCADNGKTPLHFAFQRSRIDTAVMLIQRGADIPPDITPACLMSAFYLAFANGNVEVVAILVKKGVDVTQISVLHPSTDPRLFIHEAARDGNLGMVKALVTDNPHFIKVINYADPHGQTALMHAAANGHAEVVAYLLDKGADLNAVTHGFAEKEDNNITALDLAKKYKHFNIVALLLQKMADVTKPVDPIVKYFINQKNDQSTYPDYSSYLNSLQACLQEDFNTAVLQGNHEMVARLLPYVNAGMLLNPELLDPVKFTPLHHAVWVGDLKMVGILIDHNPDCSYLLKQEDAFGRTPLWIAAAQWIAADDNGPLDKDKVKQSYLNILLFLLDQGADSTKIVEPDDGIALLHRAVRRGGARKRIIEALVTNFILLNQKMPERLDLRDADGATPLLLAVIDGDTEMADFLIGHGANPNLVYQHPSNANCADNGKTPLHLAFQHGRIDTAVMLIQRGVHIPPDITLACLMSAFYLAFANGNVEVVAILVKKGIDVTQISVLHPSKNSRPFIHEAARGGNLGMVEALVTGNPHFKKVINYANPYGQTALMYAAGHGHAKVVAYLLNKGADLNAVTYDGFTEKEDNNITALDLAKRYKHFNIVALLLQKKADAKKPADPVGVAKPVDPAKDLLRKKLLREQLREKRKKLREDKREFLELLRSQRYRIDTNSNLWMDPEKTQCKLDVINDCIKMVKHEDPLELADDQQRFKNIIKKLLNSENFTQSRHLLFSPSGDSTSKSKKEIETFLQHRKIKIY